MSCAFWPTDTFHWLQWCLNMWQRAFLNSGLFPFKLKIWTFTIRCSWLYVVCYYNCQIQGALTLSGSRYILHFKFSYPPKRPMLHKDGFYSLQRSLAKLNHSTGKHSYAFFFSSFFFFFCCGFILYSLGFLDVMVVKITLKTEQWQNWASSSNVCLRCSGKSQLRGISCPIQIQMLTLLTL